MGLIRTYSPAPILTPEQARAHLRIDDAGEDTLLAGLIAAATDYVERETATAIGEATFAFTIDSWPSDKVIRLPVPPLLSIESITYRNAAGGTVTLATDKYVVDVASKPGRVYLLNRPELSALPAAVTVTFSAGYAADEIPPTLLHAVKMLVGHFYENREAAIDRRVDTVPLAVASLLLKHTFIEAV